MGFKYIVENEVALFITRLCITDSDYLNHKHSQVCSLFL